MATATIEEGRTVTELERIPFGSPPEDVARIVARDGGVILTGALTRDQVDAVNGELDGPFGALRPGNFSTGEDSFIADFYGHTTVRLLHCVRYSKTLRDAFLDQAIIQEYAAATMTGPVGSHTMYSSQGIAIHPGEKVQMLHRDDQGLASILGTHHRDGTSIQVNFLLALTEVTEEMGATRVIPGSHLWEDFTDPGTHEQTIPATMEPGDVLFINGKVLHGGGANVTEDRVRRVLSTAISPGIILGEEAWPHVIPLEEVKTYSPRLQAMLGFHSISVAGEQPGFLWRAESLPLQNYLKL